MDMDAIVFTSNSGYTEQYARLLGEAASLPVYSLASSAELPRQSHVIYLGWLMAGTVKGFKKARKRFDVRGVCAVGMAPLSAQNIGNLIRQNHIPDGMPLFCLQGGFDIRRLHGIYRWMMNAMVRGAGKKLAEKADKTPEERDMLELMLHGGDRVSVQSLVPVLDWMKGLE